MNGAERADLAALPAITSRGSTREERLALRVADRLDTYDQFIEALIRRLRAGKKTRAFGDQADREWRKLRMLERQPMFIFDDPGYYRESVAEHLTAFEEWQPQQKFYKAAGPLHRLRQDLDIVESCLRGLERATILKRCTAGENQVADEIIERCRKGPEAEHWRHKPTRRQVEQCVATIWRDVLGQRDSLTTSQLAEIIAGHGAASIALRLVCLARKPAGKWRWSTVKGRDDLRRKLRRVQPSRFAYF